VIWAKLSCLCSVPPVMSRSIALTTSSNNLRDSSFLEHEGVPPLFNVRFSVYQEQNTALEARCSASSSGLFVKNTECWDVARLQLGWFINQACPNEVDMTSFIRDLLSRTISSISFFPVLSISLRRERGTMCVCCSNTKLASNVVCSLSNC
jgi:hypothetical protein